MSRSGRRGRSVAVLVGLGLVACSLDSSVPGRDSATSPVSSGVAISGAGAPDGDDAVAPVLDDIDAGANRDPFPDDAGAGGELDSGGAPDDESAAGRGGRASGRGGAGGVGGSAAHGGNAGATASGGVGGASNPPPTLFFSEYVEGSSAYKALELSAQARSVLDGCKVGTYFNGKAAATIVATLSGVLEANHVLTICTSALKTKLGAVCSQVGNLTFNGNDAVAISCDGKLLDVIGQIGADPGVAWGLGTSTTTDHTLRRKCALSAGDPNGLNAFDPSGEWLAFPVDTFAGLGTRGC